MLKLINKCTEASWDTCESAPVRKGRVPVTFGQTGYVKPFLKYHTVLPSPIDDNIVLKMMDQMLKLRSEATIADTMTLISNGAIQHSTGLDGHPNRDLIDEIDEYCCTIIRYLTASNWTASYSIIYSQIDLYKTFSGNENDIIPNSDLLSMIYLDEKSIIALFKELWLLLASVKSPLHQSLIFYFFSVSLEYWIVARPEEYYEAISSETSPLTIETNGFFDYLYTASENSKYYCIMIRFLTILICLLPNVFNAYLTSGMKRFTTNSKKLKLLSYLKSQLHVTSVGDLLLVCMSTIATAASSIYKFDAQNPIVKFAVGVSLEIQPIVYNYANDMSPSVMHIYAELFTAYCIIKPEFIEHSDFRNLLEGTDIEPSIICCVAVALRAAGSVPQCNNMYMNYMKQNGRVWRNMIWKQSRLLLKSRASGNSSKKSLSTSNSEAVNLPIIINVYYAFAPYPLLYFEDLDAKQNGSVIKYMDPIVTSLVDYDGDLVQASTEFIKALISPSRILNISPDDVNLSKGHIITQVYSCCGYLIGALSDNILDSEINVKRVSGSLSLINELLKCRALIAERFKLLGKSGNNFSIVEGFETRQRLYTSLESAILSCLCSPDVEIYKVVIQAIDNVLKDAYATEDMNGHVLSCPMLYNSDIYKEFNTGNFVITGQVALQKRIRKIIKQLTVATDGIINAWSSIHRRWIDLHRDEETYQTKFAIEVRNYGGMLSSLSGCILTSDSDTNDKVAAILPNIHTFIQSLVDYLISPNLVISDYSKEMISRELSGDAWPYAYDCMVAATKRLMGLPNKDQALKLLGQVIGVTKIGNLRCVDEGIDIPAGAIEVVWTVAQYLTQQNYNNPNVLRLLITVTQTNNIAEENKDNCSFKVAKSLKYQVAMLFADICQKSSFYKETDAYAAAVAAFGNSERRIEELDNLYFDMALESAKAAALLSSITFDVPQTGSEDDYLQTKSALCGQQFSGIMSILEYWDGILHDNESTIHVPSSNNSVVRSFNSSKSSDYFIHEQKRRAKRICDYCITSMSNMTRVNMDVALKFAIPMGYHKNAMIRSSFLGIFTDLVLQGKSNVINKSDNERFTSLLKFLVENIHIAVDLCENCPVTEVDGLASALMNLFETQGKGLSLLKAAVTREIHNTVRVVDLLRRNSVATRLLSLYAHKYGSEYLSSTLGPILKSFMDSPDEHVFELSADKFNFQDSKAKENIDKFMRSLSAFSGAFLRSLDAMPKSFKEICYTIQQTTIPKFPEASITSVGCFLFLRFFCPAIVAPETENLLTKQPRRDVRRSLLLLAKVIQNMANGSLYSLKLPLLYNRMKELNRVNDYIIQFMKSAAEIPFMKNDLLDMAPVIEINNKVEGIDIDKIDKSFIHEYLHNHWEGIHLRVKSQGTKKGLGDARSVEINNNSASSLSSSDSDAPDSKLYNKLDELVEALGQPKGSSTYQLPESITNNTTEAGIRLYEFMVKHASKDFGSMTEKQLIRQAVTRDGDVFLVVNIGLFGTTNIGDPEMVIYRFFQVAANLWDKKFALLMDCTGFTNKNSIPVQIITQVDALFPPNIRTCRAVYYYNISKPFIPYLNHFISQYSGGNSVIFDSYTVKYIFTSSFYETEEMNVPPFGLTHKTLKIAKDVRIEFSDVSMYLKDEDKQTGVEMRIGEEYVQICRIDPAVFDCGGRTRYVRPMEAYHVTDLKKAYVSNAADSGHFTVELEDGEQLILFSKEKSTDIIRSVNAMISRYSENSSSTSDNEGVVHSIKDVAASFTTMAFSGLTSEENEVRSVAYRLACETVDLFDFKTGKSRNSRKDLYFPAHNTFFCSDISESISMDQPEMTYDFIKAFSSAFINSSMKQRGDILNMLSKWVGNIYKYIYLVDNAAGKKSRRTREIIRNLIKLTMISPEHVASFHESIWEPIFQTPELADVLLDQIIESAIDRNTEGKDCEDIISILTVQPSLEMSGKAISRLIKIASVPIESASSQISHVQGNWNELIVMVKACVAIFFDKLEYCKAYFPELCFLCTSFLDIGPFEFREYLHELTLNSLHTFTNLKDLSVETHNKISFIVERFSGSRARLIYGLNRTTTDFNVGANSETGSGLEFVCNSIFEFFETVGEENDVKNWRSKWTSYIIDAAFKKASLIRGRALIVMGLLVKDSTADVLIPRILKLTTRSVSADQVGDTQSSDLNECVLYCFTKLIDDLSPNSAWIPVMFWFGCACSHFAYPGIYLGGISLMARAMKKLDESHRFPDGDVIGYLTEERNNLGNYLNEMDELLNMKYSPSNFHIYICALLVKGINYSPTRHIVMEVMTTIINICAKNANIYKEKHAVEIPNLKEFILSPMIYAIFLLLNSRTDSEKKHYLQKYFAASGSKIVKIGEGFSIPNTLIEFFESDCDEVLIAIYMAVSLMNEPTCEELVCHKFVRCLIFFGDKALRPKFMSFTFFSKKLKEICDHYPSLQLVNTCQEFLTNVYSNPQYDYSHSEEYLNALMQLVNKYKVTNLNIRGLTDIDYPFMAKQTEKFMYFTNDILSII